MLNATPTAQPMERGLGVNMKTGGEMCFMHAFHNWYHFFSSNQSYFMEFGQWIFESDSKLNFIVLN